MTPIVRCRHPARLEDLLDDCADAFGQPLARDARDRIRALDATPGPTTWNDAYSIVIRAHDPLLTLWQAVAAVDPRCPAVLPVAEHDALDEERRWRGYHPSRLTLRIALRHATAHLHSATHSGGSQ